MSRIKKLLRKFILGFIRMRNKPLPYVSDAKRYGNEGEDSLVYHLERTLPGCKIKRNILIYTPEGNAEIDCLVFYQNKLFAIEVKSWKGALSGDDTGIVQEKTDQWTDEIHTKYHKSPFKQINRAVHLLRKQIPGKVWVNPIVFFEGADSVDIDSSYVWVSSLKQLLHYIKTQGEFSPAGDAERFFAKSVAADLLYNRSENEVFRCYILDKCLRLRVKDSVLSRKDIVQIKIEHHWSYDTLYIYTRTGKTEIMNLENAKIAVLNNGEREVYGLSKIDLIWLG